MKNKKTIVMLLLISIFGVIGLTISYFSNNSSIENQFNTKMFGTTVSENFVSPSDWQPGDITKKEVFATNTGQVDEAVRIKFSESWTTANEGTLNGWITSDGTKVSSYI